MLSPELQKQVDSIFVKKRRESAVHVESSAAIAHNIFGFLRHSGYAVSFEDVDARVSLLIAQMSYASSVSPVNKGGRPAMWCLPTKTIRLPEKYHSALQEIALEWQENEFGQPPF